MLTPPTTTTKPSAPGSLCFCEAGDLVSHPHSRAVLKTGPAWPALLDSIRQRGVIVPLLVRQLPEGGKQVIDGHRRVAAAAEIGCMVPCYLLPGSAAEAMEVMLIQAVHSTAAGIQWPARIMAAIKTEFFSSAERIAERICADVGRVADLLWILELDDNVLQRLDLPMEDPDRLSLDAALEILKVPPRLRPRAVDLVLNPEFAARCLTGTEAKQICSAWITLPEEARLSWKARGALESERLASKHAEDLGEIDVRPVGWDYRKKFQDCGLDPFAPVPASELTAAAPAGVRWVDVARRYGLNLWAIPAIDEGGEAFLRLSREAVNECEDAAKECRQVCWLVKK
jgi:ParB/RepB/Spo0J family partition protein